MTPVGMRFFFDRISAHLRGPLADPVSPWFSDPTRSVMANVDAEAPTAAITTKVTCPPKESGRR